MKRRLSFCFGLFACLFAEERALTSFENDSSTLIEGKVHVITGDLVIFQEDLVIHGAEPIRISRAHIDGPQGNWFHGVFGTVLEEHNRLIVYEKNGAPLVYGKTGKEIVDNFKYYRYQPINLSVGFTNTSHGKISSRTNLKNQYLLIDKSQSHFIVHTAEGTKRTYHQNKPNGYHIYSEELPNGHWVLYDYEEILANKKIEHRIECLKSIRTTNADKTKTFARADFLYEDPKQKNHHCYILGSDGGVLEYCFHNGQKPHSGLLSSITSSDFPTQTYQYISNPLEKSPLKRVQFPLGRFIQFDYYSEGDQWNRVKTLSLPLGNDPNPQITHSFVYDLKNKKTSVYEIDGSRTDYWWQSNDRLNKIERFSKERELLNSEQFVWGQDEPDLGNLLCKTFLDEKGSLLFLKQYVYDPKGNILEERFYGRNPEEYSFRRFSYSSASFSLLLEENEMSGLRIVYEYLPGTDLAISQFTYDGQVLKMRKFWEYDSDLILTRETSDDGSSPHREEFTGVKVRTIRTMIPFQSGPYVGMPQIIEEKYWENGKEYPLTKTILIYGNRAQVVQKDVYDAEGVFRYYVTMNYDGKGHLIRETNPLCQVQTSRYDEGGNQIFSQDFSGRKTTAINYDFSNRPKQVQVKGDDGIELTWRTEYDKKHCPISEIDPQGNETKHSFDSLGRRLKTELPSASNSLPSYTRWMYDSAGNEICRINGEGNAINTVYNAYGKPLVVAYPDGAKEKYSYTLNGLLKAYTDPLGVVTHFTYDYLGRIVKKIVGNHLAEDRFIYYGNRLVAKIDVEGNRTEYSYDGAGRKIAEEVSGEKTVYTYDPLGREVTIQKGDQVLIRHYDLLNREIEVREESARGDVIREIRYTYDEAGNQTMLTRFVAGKEVLERKKYDSFQRLIEKTDPLGALETIVYNDKFQNDQGQTVRQKTHTDPMGLQTVETFDTRGRSARIQILKEGAALAETEKHYDREGKLSYQIDQAFTPVLREIRTQWTYNSRGRLEKLIEAEGTSDAKITEHQYTLRGEKANTIKPDGVILFYEYDDLGALVSLLSSDGTVCHQMKCDKLGHLIWNDGLERIIDHAGRLLHESFPSGLFLENQFNRQGLRVKTQIPIANCLIEFTYNGSNMTEVVRKTGDGTLLYTHNYAHRDLSGNLLASELPNNLGAIHYLYDVCSRKKSIKSPCFTQKVLQQDLLGNILCLQTQGDESFFAYDNLYQLSSERGLFNHNYVHDSFYCRLQKDQESYQVNALNQLVSHLQYDKNGNVIKNGPILYTYDALDRLIRIQTPEIIQTFCYDFLNRRLSSKNGETIRYFLYDGQNEIASFDEDLQPIELRILGETPHAEIGAAIAVELAGKAYAPIHDLSGNLAALLPLDGGQETIYRYSAFGEEKIYRAQEGMTCYGRASQAGSPTTLRRKGCESTIDSNAEHHSQKGKGEKEDRLGKGVAGQNMSNLTECGVDRSPLSPWRFSSKRVDESGLVYYGRRFYMPSFGRWLSPDPSGFKDGMNLYAYVHNDPLIHGDEYGLITYVHGQGWQNCPWGSPFSYSHNTPKPTYYTPPPAHWNRSGSDTRLIPSLDLHYKRAPHYYVNGIYNTPSESRIGSKALMQTLGPSANVIPIYSESFGRLRDQFSVYQSKNNPNYSSFAVRRINREVRGSSLYMDALNDSRKIFMTGFSRGAADIYHGVKNCLPEQKNRLIITACGPIMILPRDLGFSVTNLVSDGDWCSMFCNRGLGRNPHKFDDVADVSVLPQMDGFTGFNRDHFFLSRTYQEGIKLFTAKNYEQYGGPR